MLVVPFLDWGNLQTNNLKFAACFRDNMHALGTPTNLNGVVREVLGEVGHVFGTTALASTFVLGGHSRAYDFLDPLAMAHGDPEMSKGALGKLSEVWALDTTYTCPIDHWLCWLASKPSLTIRVFYSDNSKTAACGRRFAGVAPKTGKRLQVAAVAEGHCAVPIRRLPKLLNPGSTVTAPKARKEVDEELDEAFAWDEDLRVNREEESSAEHEAGGTWQDLKAGEHAIDEYDAGLHDAHEAGGDFENEDEVEADAEELEADQSAYERDESLEVSQDFGQDDESGEQP